MKVKQSKGITLIALIITIIVLLILAGVTISMLTGENGILNQATHAKDTTDKSEFEEQVKLAIMASKTNTSGKIDTTTLENEILKIDKAEISKSANQTLPWIITKDKNKYVIEEDGTLDSQGTKDTLLNKVNSNKQAYYGKKVSGYTANGVSDWRIFYSDSTNVYLISTDYITSTKAVECDNILKAVGDYAVYGSIPSGFSSDTTNHVARFNPVIDGQTIAWTNGYNNNENDKIVSTLLDTSLWTAFVDEKKADKAIGSATLNMWVASWNTKYPNEKVYSNAIGKCGYLFGINSTPKTSHYTLSAKEGYLVDEKDNMYFPHKQCIGSENCYGYMLSSQSNGYHHLLMLVDFYGSVGNSSSYMGIYENYSFTRRALRPVVSLRNSVTTSSTEENSVILLD